MLYSVNFSDNIVIHIKYLKKTHTKLTPNITRKSFILFWWQTSGMTGYIKFFETWNYYKNNNSH
jgi:hypothetical protein